MHTQRRSRFHCISSDEHWNPSLLCTFWHLFPSLSVTCIKYIWFVDNFWPQHLHCLRVPFLSFIRWNIFKSHCKLTSDMNTKAECELSSQLKDQLMKEFTYLLCGFGFNDEFCVSCCGTFTSFINHKISTELEYKRFSFACFGIHLAEMNAPWILIVGYQLFCELSIPLICWVSN